jgi:hypothetical protein
MRLFFPRSVRGQETRVCLRHPATWLTNLPSSVRLLPSLFAFGLGVRPLGRKRPLGLFATLCPPLGLGGETAEAQGPPPLASRVTTALSRRSYCRRLPSSSAGVGTLLRAACWIIGPMRRARYSANLRAAGQVLLGASVLIGARVLLVWSPAGLLVISTLLNLKCLWHVGTVCHRRWSGTRRSALMRHSGTPQCWCGTR